MKITYLGHSCFHIETKGKHLVLDPFISPNEKARHIKVDEIKADYILLSHGHGDHVADAERIAKNNKAVIVSSYEVCAWFEKKGIEIHDMNPGGKWEFDFGVVKMTAATHSSSLPDGSYGANPAGFVVWNEDICFYYSGDTGLTWDMKLIPMTCPKLDFAIFPIGDNYTMGYDDATLAADFVECNTIIGCHYDTFEYIKIDKAAAQAAFEARGKRLLLPALGESLHF